MTHYLAQRGTKVALVEARSMRHAGPLAAKALRLSSARPRAGRRRRPMSPWPVDWRGASLRRATRAEADAFAQAVDQQAEVRAMTRTALREAMRGHEQGVLA